MGEHIDRVRELLQWTTDNNLKGDTSIISKVHDEAPQALAPSNHTAHLRNSRRDVAENGMIGFLNGDS